MYGCKFREIYRAAFIITYVSFTVEDGDITVIRRTNT